MHTRTLSILHGRFGAAIREYRTALGLTQAELAARLDCRTARVGEVERGQRNITIITLGHYFAALNAEPTEVPPPPAPAPSDKPSTIALLETFAKALGASISPGTLEAALTPDQGRAHDEAHDHVNRSERRILSACRTTPRTTPELLKHMGYTTRTGHFQRSVNHLIAMDLLEFSMPARPRSKHQKYRLTDKGRAWLVAHRI